MSAASRDAAEVMAYYAQGLERDRLAGGPGALEFARTRVPLECYLPPPPAVVADVGGGPGRYAVWLAERGYLVHLIDPVPLHVEQARTAAGHRPGAALAPAARCCPSDRVQTLDVQSSWWSNVAGLTTVNIPTVPRRTSMKNLASTLCLLLVAGVAGAQERLPLENA